MHIELWILVIYIEKSKTNDVQQAAYLDYTKPVHIC